MSVSSLSGCLIDQRGSATIEYVIVLALLAVGTSVAVIDLGARLLALFVFQRALLLSPFP